MKMNDEELRQAMQTLETYNKQLENVSRQARILQNSRDEAVRAHRTLEALNEAQPGDEVLVPIGSSCLVNVRVSDKKEAVVGVGSKISVTKDFPAAIEHLDSNVKELNEAIQKTIAAMQEIQAYVEQLSAAIQNEYDLRQQQSLDKQ